MAAEDEVGARRLLLPVYTIYTELDRPERALHWIQSVREEAGGAMPSMAKLEWILLQKLGRPDEAEALVATLDPVPRAILEDELLTARLQYGRDAIDRFDAKEVDRFVAAFDDDDLFTYVGIGTGRLEVAVQVYARLGEWDSAVRTAKRLLREFDDNLDRRATIDRVLMQHLGAVNAPIEAVLDFTEYALPDLNLQVRRRDDGVATIEAVARYVVQHGGKDGAAIRATVRRYLAGEGAAGDAIVARVEELLAGR
ncbi:MAG: hypothetical protein R3F34_07460 [Planctomycetota bacterium]